MSEKIKQEINAAFENKNNKNKYWAVMLFNTEIELGISNKPNKWVNTRNLFFTEGITALDTYANTPNPASQIIDGKTPEELAQNMEEMLINYSDEKWLEENLYPFM